VARIEDVKQLQTGIPGSLPGSMPGGPGEDWLGRVNATINNFKELVKLYQSLSGVNMGADNSVPDAMSDEGGKPGLNKNTVVKYLDIAISQGYGDKTVDEILAEASPFTLKQIQEFLKHV